MSSLFLSYQLRELHSIDRFDLTAIKIEIIVSENFYPRYEQYRKQEQHCICSYLQYCYLNVQFVQSPEYLNMIDNEEHRSSISQHVCLLRLQIGQFGENLTLRLPPKEQNRSRKMNEDDLFLFANFILRQNCFVNSRQFSNMKSCEKTT